MNAPAASSSPDDSLLDETTRNRAAPSTLPAQQSMSVTEALQAAAGPRDREACAGLKGTVYQGLVTIDRLMELGTDELLIIEAAEDIVVQRGADPATGIPLISERVSVKHTDDDSMTWTDEPVRLSILEFLIQYKHPPVGGTRLQFVLLSPARLGPAEGGRRRGVLGEWQRYVADTQREQQFLGSLRRSLQAACRSPKASAPLARAGMAAINATSDAELADFIRCVRWEGRHPSADALRQNLAERIEREHGQALELPGSTCVHILVSTILERASDREPLHRVLDAAFIRQTLHQAMPYALAWRTDEYRVAKLIETQILPGIDAVGAAIREGREEARARDQDLRQHLTSVSGGVEEILRRLDAHGITEPAKCRRHTVDDFPLGTAIGTRSAQFEGITADISAGRYFDAIATCQRLLPDAIADERPALNYYYACALAGFDQHLAAEQATQAAREAHGTGWDLLFEALAVRWSHGVPRKANLLQLMDTTQDENLRDATRLMLAEIAYTEDDGDAMWRWVEGLSRDRRAGKLRVRACLEQGDFEKASRLLEGEFCEDDPEGLRLHAELALQELVRVLQDARDTDLPPGFAARCDDVIARQRRAIAACMPHAKYRRLELVSNCGMVHMWARRLDEAVRYMREALKLDPSTPLTRLNLAQALFLSDHDTEALAEARTVLVHAHGAEHWRPRANARLLITAMALHGTCDESEGQAMCQAVRADRTLPADLRAQARRMKACFALRAKRLDDVQRQLDAWPADERDQHFRLVHATLLEDQGRHQEALDEAMGIDRDTGVDRDIRHHARLLASVALANLDRIPEAIAIGRKALSPDCRWHGVDLVLGLLGAAGRTTEAEALEQQVLASDPRNEPALTRRLQRHMRNNDLMAAAAAAVALAEVTGAPQDIYRGAALLWTIGQRDRAADLMRTIETRVELLPHLLLAAQLAAHRGDSLRALELAVTAYERHDGAPDAARLVVKESATIVDVGALPAALQVRVQAVYQRLQEQPGADPVLQSVPDIAALMQRLQVLHNERLRHLRDYENEAWTTAKLALMTGIAHAEVVFDVLETPNLHLHTGDMEGVAPWLAEIVTGTIGRFIFDLPSLAMAVQSGVFKHLRARMRIGVSTLLVMELYNYRDTLRHNVQLAEGGRLGWVTVRGLSRYEAAPLRERLAQVEAILQVVTQDCEIIQVRPAPDHPELERVHVPATRDLLNLVHHACAEGSDCVVLAAGLRFNTPHLMQFNHLVALAGHLRWLTSDAYSAVLLRLLRVGVRRLGISLNAIRFAYRVDGDAFGEHTRLLLSHAREGQWDRRIMVGSLGRYLCGVAAGHRHAASADVAVRFIAGMLHGRSFDRASRRQLIRRIRRNLHAGIDERWDPAVQVEALGILHRIERAVVDGDRFAGDEHVVGRKRLRALKPGL